MDQYIKMCQEATEIQILWEPNRFDVYSERGSTGNIIDPAYMADKHRSTMTWLPRIEDLLKFLDASGISPYCKFTLISNSMDYNRGRALEKWFDTEHPKYQTMLMKMSMREVWLCFVMKIYGKIWNGTTWETA